MRKFALRVFAAVCIGGFFCAPAAAQVACGDHERFVSALREQFRERPAGQGVTTAGRLLRLFVSDAGTWTVLVVLPDGRACAVAHGEGWQGGAVSGRSAHGGRGPSA